MSRLSRYDGLSGMQYKNYPNSASLGDQPERTDLTVGRRYTTWKSPADSLTHEVSDGETLWSLSTEYYGAPDFWYILADFNPQILPPFALTEGQVLIVPPHRVLGGSW